MTGSHSYPRAARQKLLGALMLTVIMAIGLPAGSIAKPPATVNTSPQTLPVTPAPGPTGSPFSPGVPQAPATVPTVTTPAVTSSSTPDSGLSGSNALIIAIGAIVMLGAISLFIWRDARRRAPVRQQAAAAAAGAGGRAGSKQRGKPRRLSAAEKRRRKRGRAR